MSRPTGLKALIAHRNLLIALTRYLMQDRTGGVLGAAIEMLVKVLKARGALAYLVEGDELVLVAHNGLPRRAKAWLSHLPMSGEPWFVAQRVAHERKREVDTELAASRAGMGIRPALEEAGWKALAGFPLMVGRDVLGALVLAASSEGAFDRETMNMLEAVGGILALSLERERSLAKDREDKAREAETAQLATMGLVASNVARELAAPVGALSLQLDQQQTELRELRRLIDEVEGIEEAHVDALKRLQKRARATFETVERMQGLTSRLLSFSRESQPETVDLARIVERVIDTAQSNVTSKGVALRVEGAEDELPVDGREESLQMLVLQLVLYASQECAGATDEPEVVVRVYPDREHNVVAVAATGRSGQQSGKRIYGSMVKGNRAAVGLALAKQTALMHGGRVETGISDLGGVLLKVTLPASEGRASHPASTPVPASGDPVEAVVYEAVEAAPRAGGIDLDLELPPGTAPSRPPPAPEPFVEGRDMGLELELPGSGPPPAVDGPTADEPAPEPRRRHGSRKAKAPATLMGIGMGGDPADDLDDDVDPDDVPTSIHGRRMHQGLEDLDDAFEDEASADEAPHAELDARFGEASSHPPAVEPSFDDQFDDSFSFGEDASDTPAEETDPPPLADRPVVLWIDDETEAAAAIVEELDGYEIRILRTAAEARDAIASLSAAPELVLCSVALPDGSGPELHADADFTLASRFVFIVGGLVSGDQAAYVQRSGCPTMIKPLSADEVRGMLGHTPSLSPPSATPGDDLLDLEW